MEEDEILHVKNHQMYPHCSGKSGIKKKIKLKMVALLHLFHFFQEGYQLFLTGHLIL